MYAWGTVHFLFLCLISGFCFLFVSSFTLWGSCSMQNAASQQPACSWSMAAYLSFPSEWTAQETDKLRNNKDITFLGRWPGALGLRVLRRGELYFSRYRGICQLYARVASHGTYFKHRTLSVTLPGRPLGARSLKGRRSPFRLAGPVCRLDKVQLRAAPSAMARASVAARAAACAFKHVQQQG